MNGALSLVLMSVLNFIYDCFRLMALAVSSTQSRRIAKLFAQCEHPD